MAERKTAIVTGAARPWGLGRAAALQFAETGMNVVIADLREDWGMEGARDIQRKTGNKAVFIKTDVSSPESLKSMVRQTTSDLGRIDVLANIAAKEVRKRIDEIDEAHFDSIVNVNLKGTMFACQAVIPEMRKVGGGHIVNIASGGAIQPLKGLSAYAATKAGVMIFSKILAWEVARDNIIVTTVAAGRMPTAMGAEHGPGEADYARASRSQPFQKSLFPDEVARVIVFAGTLASPALTGQTLHANGGAFMV